MNFLEECQKIGIHLNDEQLLIFEKYYQFLIFENEKMNLTAIKDKEEVYRKHFYDSLTLWLVPEVRTAKTFCDVGSGAGFPGIPLAIVRKDLELTIIDSLNKRINFLNSLSSKLNLNNVLALHYRAEDYAKEKKEFFDVVTARAVARLNVLVELCLPLCKLGGIFIAMKGSTGKEELEEGKRGIEILGGKIEEVRELTLPDEQDKRQIIIIRKIKNTPDKYPRTFAKIKEKPL